jgi:hypothetical protein
MGEGQVRLTVESPIGQIPEQGDPSDDHPGPTALNYAAGPASTEAVADRRSYQPHRRRISTQVALRCPR